jgi:cell wall-associated NlpC family hydrolase
MSDRRLTPDPARVTRQEPARITAPLAALCREPMGARDRQLIHGDPVTVLNEAAGWSYVRSEKDGYVGHVETRHLGPVEEATHKVIAPATHAYAAADLKSGEVAALTFGSRLRVTGGTDRFAETPIGFVPRVHLVPVDHQESDPAAVAARFLGTPYLWGGNSRAGIDCSGLVQAALLACGIPCPGDSDMQQALGVDATGNWLRNDLLFWKGHVALVGDPATMIHANAHAMAVTYEPIEAALARIEAAGDGPLTAHRRLPELASSGAEAA